jgi:hypothetical protein
MCRRFGDTQTLFDFLKKIRSREDRTGPDRSQQKNQREEEQSK